MYLLSKKVKESTYKTFKINNIEIPNMSFVT